MLPEKRTKKGFTLIELLIVIAVIGSLASLAIISIQPAQKQARDARRKSDLKQYQTALELYANNNTNNYPILSSGYTRVNPNLCTPLGMTSAGCIEDPKAIADSSYVYRYYGSTSGYVLWAKSEVFSTSSSSTYWVFCSNGKTGTVTSSPTSATCPLP